MRLRVKAAVLVLSTAAAVGMFAAPANANVNRGKAGCVNWMYTDRWGGVNFYYHSRCATKKGLKIAYWPWSARPDAGWKFKCINIPKGKQSKTWVGGAIESVKLVTRC
jgi:hypothetical protein